LRKTLVGEAQSAGQTAGILLAAIRMSLGAP
jgi:hypothetical protein